MLIYLTAKNLTRKSILSILASVLKICDLGDLPLKTLQKQSSQWTF